MNFLANMEPGTFITLLVGAVTTLGGTVAFLGKWILDKFNEDRKYVLKKLDDCEEDRCTLWAALADRTGHGETPEQMRETYKKKTVV